MNIRILAPAAVLALAACGGGGDETPETNTMAENMTVATGEGNLAMGNETAPAPGTAASTGQEYATMAAASDMFEIESSRLAQQKGENAQVKEFAQMLITDHQRSTEQLTQAAQQAQPPITMTPAMNPQQQSNMQALQAASGAEFDRLYIQQQIPAHEQALALVQGFAQNGDVPALKQHAQTVSGPIQRHLEQARQLQQQAGQ